MGSLPSKASRGAAGRKFPLTPSKSAVSRATPKDQLAGANPQPTDGSKSEAIRADAMDPDAASGGFSHRLQQMGMVQPNPTYSPSSTASPQQLPGSSMGSSPMMRQSFAPSNNNPTLRALEVRQRLQQQAEHEFEHMRQADSPGRQLIDMRTLIEAMRLLDHGMLQVDVEKKLLLANGLLSKLGGPSILSHESIST